MLALCICSLFAVTQPPGPPTPPAAQEPVEEVLALLPRHAAGFVLVPNLEGASDDLQATLKAMDRAGLLFAGDPLDHLVSALGIPLLLDRQGAAMIAWVLPPDAPDAPPAGDESATPPGQQGTTPPGQQRQPSPDDSVTHAEDDAAEDPQASGDGLAGGPIIVAFIPSHDPQEFLDLNFQPTEAEGRFLHESGTILHGRALRTHAAVSLQPLDGLLSPIGQDGLADLLQRWPSQSLELVTSADLALAGNARAVDGAIGEVTSLLRQTAIGGALLPDDPARDDGPISRLFRAIASSSAGGVTAVDFDPLAVIVRTSAQLREVDEVEVRAQSRAGLAAFPNAPYHLALSINLMPMHRFADWRSSVPFLGQTETDRWLSLVQAASFAAYESPTGLRGGLFNDAALILTTDKPEEVRDLIRRAVRSVPEAEGGIERRVSWREGRPIEGVGEVDVFEIRLAHVPDDQLYRQFLQRLLFGPVGINGFVHRFERGVIVTFSQRPDILRRVTASLRGGENLGDDQTIAAMRQWLPGDPDIEWFVDLASMMELLRHAMEFYPMLPDLPAYDVQDQLPPIGFSASLDDTRIDATTIIPSAVAGILLDQLMSIIPSDEVEPAP